MAAATTSRRYDSLARGLRSSRASEASRSAMDSTSSARRSSMRRRSRRASKVPSTRLIRGMTSSRLEDQRRVQQIHRARGALAGCLGGALHPQFRVSVQQIFLARKELLPLCLGRIGGREGMLDGDEFGTRIVMAPPQPSRAGNHHQAEGHPTPRHHRPACAAVAHTRSVPPSGRHLRDILARACRLGEQLPVAVAATLRVGQHLVGLRDGDSARLRIRRQGFGRDEIAGSGFGRPREPPPHWRAD